MRMRPLLLVHRLIAMPAGERNLAVEAVLLLCVARSALSLTSLSTLRAWLLAFVTPRGSSAARIRWEPIVAALSVAARRVPFRTTCLVEAVAAEAMLHRRGYDARLQNGVVRPGGAALEAHAWVELDGKVVVGQLETLRHYAVLVPRTS
jgi:hypothetical protein